MAKFSDIQSEVIAQYRITLDEHSTCKRRCHAHVRERRICKWHPKNSIVSTFDLLHEIGHIETTKSNMRRCEAEYYATQWAIRKAQEYGLDIPDKIIKVYQEYIDRELDRGIRRHGSRYFTDLTLNV